ncbi:MAG: hypothetical protein JKY93_12745 [Gammaproteobacteria bacterium]|nr:hypothetical protein [Gammaproteobacteria bacterium]
MYKGIVSSLLVSLLIGCGGSSSGSGSSEPREVIEAIDPYLGSWERPCGLVDDDEMGGQINEYLMGTSFQMFWTEKLTISESRVLLTVEFFSDDKCELLELPVGEMSDIILSFFSSFGIDLESKFDMGGDITSKVEFTADNDSDFFQYEAPNGFVFSEGPLIVNVHNIGNRLYKVEQNDFTGEDYTVNFNKYYIRAQN